MNRIDLFKIIKCLPVENDCGDTFLYHISLKRIIAQLTLAYSSLTKVDINQQSKDLYLSHAGKFC